MLIKIIYQCFLLQPQALFIFGSSGLTYFSILFLAETFGDFFATFFFGFVSNILCRLILAFLGPGIDYCLSSSSSSITPISSSTFFPLIQYPLIETEFSIFSSPYPCYRSFSKFPRYKLPSGFESSPKPDFLSFLNYP